tara:strand:+ start:54642 stop:55334 length:693 start_codon:yes stop_codon:yes gene_type:complete
MAVNRSPWSVKGVDPEAREAAKIAARRAGLTVGSWLTQTIRAAATEQLSGSKQDNPAAKQNGEQEAPSQQYNTGQQYNPSQGYNSGQQYAPGQQYNQGPNNGGHSGYDPGMQQPPQQAGGFGEQPATNYGSGQAPLPAPTIQALFESIQTLSNRVEQAERKTTAAVAPLAEQVSELSAQVEEVKSQKGVSTAPVERAVMRITERLDKMEEGRGSNRRPKSQGGWWRRNRD